MTETIALLVGGLVALLLGGELLVRGAVRLAEKAGVTPLIVGLVIVGFGTSTPELMTSVEAALAGSPSIAWGNIVGSNIVNTLVILGLAALITPVVLRGGSLLRDTGVCLAATGLLVALGWSGWHGAWIGVAMLAALIAYIARCYRDERVVVPEAVHTAAYDRQQALEMTDRQLHRTEGGWWRAVALLIVGLAMLMAGARFLVTGAIDVATIAGLSETIIGLTIVAIGTSLPELVTSVVAARRGEGEIAFGNVVGSNIYNILGIGGATMLLSPAGVPPDLFPLDLGVALATAFIILVVAIAWRRFGRLAGALLVTAYAAYVATLLAMPSPVAV
ncbi:MAG: calcium/sodium antiporter [Sphingomonas sp.]|uniref:calcium/sodium antiporter n=1 Tax=Sphingomonas sp. TaxID=28214 RepID=UPI002632FFAA|nr:calcium/sodium antiporter [Sphingomonas sp.]MDK2767461.1 calcium/sodium antiporter [Sphingomonas sp.]